VTNLGTRVLRTGDDGLGAAEAVGHERAEEQPVPSGKQLGKPAEAHVVHREHDLGVRSVAREANHRVG